jgi:hypothetical protein
MNEIAIKEINVEHELPSIKYDLAPLKEQVELIKQKYGKLVISEQDLAEAKKITAQLNKAAKEIGRKRIDITNEIKKPITEFENELKAIAKDVEDVSNDIKTQLDDYEEKRKEEKRKMILEHELWADYMVFDETWLNKTTGIDIIEQSMETQKTIFQNNSLLITTTCKGNALNPDKYLQMLVDKYPIQQIVDIINNDIQVKNEYKEQKNVETVETPTTINVEDTQDTTQMAFTLKIYGTKTQLKALRQFIDNNGMTYEKL